MIDTAVLGMLGAATAAVFTASGFVITTAVKVGKHLQVIDDMAKDASELTERVTIIDRKVERHLHWHENKDEQFQDPRPSE